MVYQSIQEGVWWPQLNPMWYNGVQLMRFCRTKRLSPPPGRRKDRPPDPMWYNGVQLMRFWAPLCAYFMAFCQFLAGGNSLNGYLLFVGLICFLGALPWLYIGFRPYKKIGRKIMLKQRARLPSTNTAYKLLGIKISEIMEGFFQNAFISLNPFDR